MAEQMMTLVEYATVKADECDCRAPRREHIAADVDALITAASALQRTLWEVGIDPEGRVSLIWASHSRETWDALNAESARVAAVNLILSDVSKALGLIP